jgi:hypothetical protein
LCSWWPAARPSSPRFSTRCGHAVELSPPKWPKRPSGAITIHALFAIGIVLFLFTLAFNLIASHVAEKHKQVGAATL